MSALKADLEFWLRLLRRNPETTIIAICRRFGRPQVSIVAKVPRTVAAQLKRA